MVGTVKTKYKKTKNDTNQRKAQQRKSNNNEEKKFLIASNHRLWWHLSLISSIIVRTSKPKTNRCLLLLLLLLWLSLYNISMDDTVPLYSRKVAGICIWRAHTAPEHSNGSEWEIYPSFMSLYLFPTERAHIYPKPTSEPANKRAKETWVCLLDSCVAFRFRSHPLLAQRIFCLPLVYVWRVCVCVLSKSFLHFGFSRAYIWPFVFFAKAKNFRTSAICWHWTKKPEKSISSTG